MLITTEADAYAWDALSRNPNPALLFQGEAVQAVAEGKWHRVLAMNGGVLVIHDDEQTRRHDIMVEHPIESMLILEQRPWRVLIGTVGAHLYELRAGATQAKRIEPFDQLACRDDWYTPWGGPPAVRSLAAGANGRVLYADIHVGSIMRSEDSGKTWEPVKDDLDEDVHQVATCPVAPDRVYANTASAVYVSDDCGRSWAHRGTALNNRYGRAIAVHPEEGDCLLASVSDGPRGGNAQLFRSDDAGHHWTHVTDGFPPTGERNIDTFQITFSADSAAWASIDRTLYTSRDRGRSWTIAWKASQCIRHLSCGR